MAKHVFLTGATGFVGQHVAHELVNQGYAVTALVRSPQRATFLKNLGVDLVSGNLNCDWTANLPDLQAVVHVAGLIKAKNVQDYKAINTLGTEKLYHHLKNTKFERFLFISSIAARGPNRSLTDFDSEGPVSAYGQSKKQAEDFLKSELPKSKLAIIRPPLVYGPGDLVTAPLMKTLSRGYLPVFGLPSFKSSFIYTKDLARWIVREIENPSQTLIEPDDGHGGYTPLCLQNIAEKVTGKKVKFIPIPKWTLRVASLLTQQLQLLRQEPFFFNADKAKELAQPYWFYKATPAHLQLTRFGEGFKETLDWLDKQK